ncbi:MAG: asparagine synthase-related protein, partial [Planctomycetota bacterium]
AALREWGRDRLPWHALAMTHLTTTDRHALRGLVHQDHLHELGQCFAAASALDPRNRQLAADTETYLPHQLLSLLDRTTMGASIEGRVPFLDHRVAEFALGIHGDRKFGGKHQNKRLLRRLAARHLPPMVATRKKHGFPNAVHRWLAPATLPALRELLLARGEFVADTLPRSWLESLLASPDSLHQNALTVHSLLVLSTWHRVFARSGRSERPAVGSAGQP